jgi:tetratricopeptide (TPR) repeat protein
MGSILAGRSDESTAYRLDVARDTARMFLQHPLAGIGLGNYADRFPAVKRGHGDVRTTHAENDVLEFIAETGLAGLAAMTTVLGALWFGLADRLRTGRDPVRLGLATGAAAACAALMTHSFLDFNLRIPANALVFGSLMGLASSPREEPARLRHFAALPVIGLLSLATLASVVRAQGAWSLEKAREVVDTTLRLKALDATITQHPYLAEAFRERGSGWLALADSPALEGGRLERALRDFSKAVRLRPAWADAWTDRAWVAFRLGETQVAARDFDRAVQLDPTNLRAGITRADFRARVFGASAGIDDLLRLRRENPGWNGAQALFQAQAWTVEPALLGRLSGQPD